MVFPEFAFTKHYSAKYVKFLSSGGDDEEDFTGDARLSFC